MFKQGGAALSEDRHLHHDMDRGSLPEFHLASWHEAGLRAAIFAPSKGFLHVNFDVCRNGKATSYSFSSWTYFCKDQLGNTQTIWTCLADHEPFGINPKRRE